MTEKYLRIDPSGDLTWIDIDRVPYDFDPSIEGPSLDQIYAALGCSYFEQVRTVIPGIVILVDESGRVKTPPCPHNELASRLYAGYLQGVDDICGPALVAAMRPTEPLGEMDLFPLTLFELHKVAYLIGVKLEVQVV